jgi:hypothetical protein
MGKPAGKRSLGRSRSRWIDDIKMDFIETGWGGVEWSGLTPIRRSGLLL